MRSFKTLRRPGDRSPGFVFDVLTVLAAVLAVYMILALGMGLSLTGHSAYDSYTLQAMAWREGKATVDGPSHTWLELAVYDGEYYVSFPPFPSVVMYPLTFIWGGDTPTLLISLIMLLLSAALSFGVMRRAGADPSCAVPFSAAFVIGCSFFVIMTRGGVWYMAQGMSFVLTTGFFLGITTRSRGRKGSLEMAAALICIALAVGCRPFQAVYVPYGLFRLYRRRQESGAPDRKKAFFRTLLSMLPYVIVPLLIAGAYGWYNMVRFGNPFEFGHNYLPEFTREGNVQFSLSHWGHNLRNIMRMPEIADGALKFDMLGPTAILLTNPLFIVSAAETVKRGIRKSLGADEIILIVILFIHFNLLLLHRTLGGMQFGVRYMADLMPAMLLLIFFRGKRPARLDWLLMLMGAAFNIYGAVVFYR